MKPAIFYLDNHILVLNKPAGMPVQADETGDLDLQTWGKAYVKDQFYKPGNVFLGLVHRLDRPVSGVVVMAKTSKAAERLAKQFRERTVKKTYWALVEGEAPQTGNLEHYILKSDKKVQLVTKTHPEAQVARLSFKRLKTNGKISLVEIDLETGRKHQIRLQFSNIGHSIIGDLRYGARLKLDGKNLALCCKAMQIKHPTTNETMLWEAELPDTWDDFMERFEKRF